MSPPDPGLDDILRRRKRVSRKKRRKRAGLSAFLAVLAVLVVLVCVGLGSAYSFSSGCNLSSLQPVAIGQNSFVYAADNSLLGSIPAERNREPVALSEVSPWVAKATVAIEDRRFWSHGGVDPQGIARAVWADVQSGKVVQGGSTITQQLVRNLYISQERTFSRKLKEVCLAIKLSHAWSKQRILAAYMNQVYYGNHAYGIEAASQTYYSKDAKDLTLGQAALLAGLPQAPSAFDPFIAPQKALARRDEVLQALLTNGDISQAQYAETVADRDLGLKPGRLYTRIREPYFFSYVRDQLIAQYGANTVRSGGLRVYTTIDPRFQNAARNAIKQTLNRPNDPAAAVVSINPGNGAIRAMAAVTPGATGNQFNLVAQARRQAGSTFKTFVLTAAVAEGMNPSTTYYTSAPFHYQPDPYTPAWNVSTYDHTYVGPISVTNATLRSDNTVYAQLTLDVGPENVAEMAAKLGVQTPLLPVPSIGLGSISVSPLDMASAYATLAAGGIYSKPMAIRKVILANGSVDTDAGWGVPQRERVIPDGVAWTVTQVLEQNVRYGTGTAAYFGRPAAGKTGTTDEHADAWFCGYLPNLEATVWVGYPKGEIPMDDVHGIAVAGGTFPAQIWHLFMQSAVEGQKPRDFPTPLEYPTFTYWHRGQYALGYYGSSTTTATTTTKAATTVSAPTVVREPAPPPASTQTPPTPTPTPLEPPAPATTTTDTTTTPPPTPAPLQP